MVPAARAEVIACGILGAVVSRMMTPRISPDDPHP